MGIIAIHPPWLRCEFLGELPLVLIFINKGAGQFYLSFDTR